MKSCLIKTLRSALAVAACGLFPMTPDAASVDGGAFHAAMYPRPNNPYVSAMGQSPTADGYDGPDPAVAASYGCLIAGAAGTGVTLAVGSENVVNVVAGGLVVPASQAALTVAVIAVVFGSFCSVGQALTPIYLDIWRR